MCRPGITSGYKDILMGFNKKRLDLVCRWCAYAYVCIDGRPLRLVSGVNFPTHSPSRGISIAPAKPTEAVLAGVGGNRLVMVFVRTDDNLARARLYVCV